LFLLEHLPEIGVPAPGMASLNRHFSSRFVKIGHRNDLDEIEIVPDGIPFMAVVARACVPDDCSGCVTAPVRLRILRAPIEAVRDGPCLSPGSFYTGPPVNGISSSASGRTKRTLLSACRDRTCAGRRRSWRGTAPARRPSYKPQ